MSTSKRRRTGCAAAAVGLALSGAAVALDTQPAGATTMIQAYWNQNPNLGSGGNADVVGFWEEIVMSSEDHWSGYCIPEQSDGLFGTNVVNGTRKFQNALGVTVDGVVGPTTWNAAEFYVPPGHAPALINNGGGYYSWYDGGAYSADLAYVPAYGGWLWHQGFSNTWMDTSYDVNSIPTPHDAVYCG